LSFELKILGSNSAAPAHNRYQTAQILKIDGTLFLIDCGEGTQLRLKKYGVKLTRIDCIFISHLHGDHYLGLVGLISTMNLYHRQQQLTIFGPIGLSEIITLQLRYSETVLNFKVDFEELNPLEPQIIYESKKIIIKSFPLNHRINCTGFSFREKPKKRRLIKEKINGIPLADRVDLKNGVDILDDDGKIVYKSEEFTLPAKRSRSYAYCSDTKYDETIVEWIKNVDLLYHEATFLDELIERAEATFHSTAKQAAKIAKKAQVKKLIIGHFSIRYKELHPLLAEAREVFEDTELAIEGESIIIEE